MYFLPGHNQAEKAKQNEQAKGSERKLRFIGSYDYDQALESSFLFEPEESGFYNVKNSRKRT